MVWDKKSFTKFIYELLFKKCPFWVIWHKKYFYLQQNLSYVISGSMTSGSSAYFLNLKALLLDLFSMIFGHEKDKFKIHFFSISFMYTYYSNIFLWFFFEINYYNLNFLLEYFVLSILQVLCRFQAKKLQILFFSSIHFFLKITKTIHLINSKEGFD